MVTPKWQMDAIQMELLCFTEVGLYISEVNLGGYHCKLSKGG